MLGNLLRAKFKFPKKKCRKLLKRLLRIAANYRRLHKKKTKKKYLHCEKKDYAFDGDLAVGRGREDDGENINAIRLDGVMGCL